jgi:hypothetical protein
MAAEYDVHRKSYKYGLDDWQLLVNILHEYSEKLLVISRQLSNNKRHDTSKTKGIKLITPLWLTNARKSSLTVLPWVMSWSRSLKRLVAARTPPIGLCLPRLLKPFATELMALLRPSSIAFGASEAIEWPGTPYPFESIARSCFYLEVITATWVKTLEQKTELRILKLPSNPLLDMV